MATLLPEIEDYHRPMNEATQQRFVASLAAAQTPVSLDKTILAFPLGQKATEDLAAGLNQADQSTLPQIQARDLHDPWTQATIERLHAVQL